ncbi:MAG: GntR family transcriptional regulator [Rhodobacteraceae bacterium]|nr:GntR family transcriptional regulator [Paracoccaceae bacterium]
MSTGVRNSWQDVRKYVRGQILNLTYRPGDKLPRDEDIARELNCARSTVHRAMRSLAEDGIIERRRKAGTKVNPDPVTRATLDIPITRIEIESRGYTYRHQLIESRVLKAAPAHLVRPSTTDAIPVCHIRTLHLADERPFVFEDRWVSLQTVPEIRDVDLAEISANEWLVHNRPYSNCDVEIFVDRTTDTEARIMEVLSGTSLLVLERTTWIDAAPITHVRAVHAKGYRLISTDRQARP